MLNNTTKKAKYQFRIVKSDLFEYAENFSLKTALILDMLESELNCADYVNNYISYNDICNGKKYFLNDTEESYSYIFVEFIQDYESKKLNQYIAYIDYVVKKKF